MAICALGYLGVRSDKASDWQHYATQILGFQRVDAGGNSVAYRMDDRKQRLVLLDEPGSTLGFMGWEVDTKDDLAFYAATLSDAGFEVEAGTAELADQRYVDSLICFDDPDGNRIELCWQPESTSEPFQPGRPIAGFKTGPVGMGHAVLHVKDANALLPFYRDLLGFSVSDFGLQPVPLYFFHVNERHHSFAMVGSGQTGFHHFMVEYLNLDDVGQGYDLAQLEDNRIAYTLGRHTNDYMTSFYSNTPSGFFVESGWGGRLINPDTWEAHETVGGPSFWGHERLYLNEDERARYRQMRLALAAEGQRTPPLPECPWLYNEFWRA